MVLKRFSLVVVLLISIGYAQNLFFTDSYLSNFYSNVDPQFIFHNNSFHFLDETAKEEVNKLILQFFEEQNIRVLPVKHSNNGILVYAYASSDFKGVEWSKAWHLGYESILRPMLKEYLAKYFNQPLAVPRNITEAALMKLAYYDWQNFKNRASNFTTTKINITTRKIDERSFKEIYISPNLTLGRMVTNSFQNFYNESYPIMNLEITTKFVFGPNSKARFKDCIAMHVDCILNQTPLPIYVNGQSVLLLKEERKVLEENELFKILKEVSGEIFTKINDPYESFYTAFDLEVLQDMVDEFMLKDYSEYERIYLQENAYNLAQPLYKIDSCFNKAILQSDVVFKTNSIQFQSKEDSLKLGVLAQFLQHNDDLELIIIGFQDSQEYTKIDKNKFKELISSYEHYPPVKSSRKADLAIYRSVVVFDYLAKMGIHPKRVSCLSSSRLEEGYSALRANWKLK